MLLIIKPVTFFLSLLYVTALYEQIMDPSLHQCIKVKKLRLNFCAFIDGILPDFMAFTLRLINSNQSFISSSLISQAYLFQLTKQLKFFFLWIYQYLFFFRYMDIVLLKFDDDFSVHEASSIQNMLYQVSYAYGVINCQLLSYLIHQFPFYLLFFYKYNNLLFRSQFQTIFLLIMIIFDLLQQKSVQMQINSSLFIKQTDYYTQNQQRYTYNAKVNMGEQTNSNLQMDKVSNEINKKSIKQRQDFALTEAQRLYIQHHLPQFFTLVAVSNTNSRLNCTSKTLVEESLTFIERRRGRPEGSVRKNLQKSILQRKSKRIAQTCKTKQGISKDNQYSSFDYSNSSQRQRQSNKNEQNQQFDSHKCAQDVCFIQASLQQHMAKTCKQSQIDDEYGKNKQLIQNFQEKELPSLSIAKQEIQKIQELPLVQQANIAKQSKQVIDKDVKPFIQAFKIEIIPQNISQAKKQVQLKYTFQQQKIIIRRLKSHRQILPFIQPVDQIRDGAPNYYKQILNPIDLQTIQFKLKTGIYKISQQFHSDVRLMWANAKSYNRKNSHMQEVTETLQNYYLNILSKTSLSAPKKKGTKK